MLCLLSHGTAVTACYDPALVWPRGNFPIFWSCGACQEFDEVNAVAGPIQVVYEFR